MRKIPQRNDFYFGGNFWPIYTVTHIQILKLHVTEVNPWLITMCCNKEVASCCVAVNLTELPPRIAQRTVITVLVLPNDWFLAFSPFCFFLPAFQLLHCCPYGRLSDHTKQLFGDVGSGLIQNVKFRDVWGFVGQRGIKGFSQTEQVTCWHGCVIGAWHQGSLAVM